MFIFIISVVVIVFIIVFIITNHFLKVFLIFSLRGGGRVREGDGS